jgi:hypothetical protein
LGLCSESGGCGWRSDSIALGVRRGAHARLCRGAVGLCRVRTPIRDCKVIRVKTIERRTGRSPCAWSEGSSWSWSWPEELLLCRRRRGGGSVSCKKKKRKKE